MQRTDRLYTRRTVQSVPSQTVRPACTHRNLPPEQYLLMRRELTRTARTYDDDTTDTTITEEAAGNR